MKAQPDQPVGVFHGQGAQQDCIHRAKDRCIGADTQGQGDHGDGRERLVLGERPCAVTQILQNRLQIGQVMPNFLAASMMSVPSRRKL